MTRRRAEQLGSDDLRLVVVTPRRPFVFFGSVPSNAVAELLAVRGVEFEGQSRASEGPRESSSLLGGADSMPARP